MLVQPGKQLHQPGDANMNKKPTPDTLAIVTNDAQQPAAKETTDGFTHWFAEMYGAVKTGHRNDTILSTNLHQ